MSRDRTAEQRNCYAASRERLKARSTNSSSTNNHKSLTAQNGKTARRSSTVYAHAVVGVLKEGFKTNKQTKKKKKKKKKQKKILQTGEFVAIYRRNAELF